MRAAYLTRLIIHHKKKQFFLMAKCVLYSKYNNIFNNVKLLHVSVTSNHNQVDISVHGHDIISTYSMGFHIVYICSVKFQILINKLFNI